MLMGMPSNDNIAIPATRDEARKVGAKWYFTGGSCSAGHVAKRMTSNATCGECSKAAKRRWGPTRKRNREYDRAHAATWAKAHPERKRENLKAWRAANPDYGGEWRRENWGKLRAYNAKYRADELKATPAWADLEAIEAVYDEAVRLQRETGVEHDCDHIVPLRAKNVCGLHVPWNLQAKPGAYNRKKGRKFNDDGSIWQPVGSA